MHSPALSGAGPGKRPERFEAFADREEAGDYAAGRFLASGRKVPREGGFILTTCESRDQVEAIVKEDPFVARGLADCRIIEFQISQRAPSIDAALAETAILESLPRNRGERSE